MLMLRRTPVDDHPRGRDAARAYARALLLIVLALLACSPARAGGSQKSNKTKAAAPPAPQAELLKRTTTRRETKRLGHGGTVTINGAPDGSITVEGWSKNEVEIVAEIEVSAGTEEDLARLAAVNGFIVESDFNRLTINTIGTHDRQYMKRAARDFPKKLLTSPWRVDYRLRVPAIVDLRIAAGRGPVSLSNVDGSVRLEAGGGAPSLFTLAGGDFEGTLVAGPVTLRVPARSWRGRGLSLRLASGDLTLELPATFDGDLDAVVLRAGRIENTHTGLVPRDDAPTPTARTLHARGGHGGATLSLTVGDGTLRIRQVSSEP